MHLPVWHPVAMAMLGYGFLNSTSQSYKCQF